jgi:hypothetical protein
MKNPEEAMEKVLTGLRDVDAPAGMERSILRALEERAVVQSRSDWRRFWPVWLVMPVRPVVIGIVTCGVALAGVVAVVLAVPAIRRVGRAPVQLKSEAAPVEPVRSVPSAAVANDAGSSLPGRDVRFVAKAKLVSAAAVNSTDSAALRAVSYPAPPMPLTEQEKLLLRVAHKGDPVEFAMLDPKLRAVKDSEEKTQFQSFFAPSAFELAALAQATADQSMQEQPVQEQAAPEKFAPDQSSTQQPTTGQSRTGDNR